MNNAHAGHRGRLKKKFNDNGFEGMYDHQILEMLLFYSIPQGDTNPLAHRLINRFGSFKNVFSAAYDELLSVKGVGEATAAWIKMLSRITAIDFSRPVGNLSVASVSGMLEFFKYEFSGADEPLAKLICADDQINVIEIVELCNYSSNGKIDKKLVEAILGSNCSQVIMAVYRPVAQTYLSEEDKAFARSLRDLLAAFNIELSEYAIIDRESAIYVLRQMRLPILWRICGEEFLPVGVKRRAVSFDGKSSPTKRKALRLE